MEEHMDADDLKRLDLATLAVHAGEGGDPHTGALDTPIHMASVFVPGGVQEHADVIAGQREGWLYTRWGNPTNHSLETRMAALEGGEAALAAASGMGAISTAILTAVDRAGEHVVAARTTYSSTHHLLSEVLPRFGVEATFVDAHVPGQVEAALRDNTRLIYIETPCNPTMQVTDIAEVAALGRARGITTMIDNTFATPALQRPLDLGLDVSVHSATKYLGGHGDTVAGILVGSRDFIHKASVHVMRHFGGILSPFAAWLVRRGLKTLPLRMERHASNAMAIARFLESRPEVARVHYPGLESHPGHEVAKRQMKAFGAMLAFELEGGLEAGRRMLDRVKLCTQAVSLGDVKTLITHPPTTSHHLIPPAERQAMGIADGLVRLSVGIEAEADLMADLEQALG
jgi:methionine-gamma-lyase